MKTFHVHEHTTVEPADLEGELGFTITLLNSHGTELPLLISSRVLCEMLEEATFQGAQVGRDYEYTIGAAINSGADRARRTPR